MGAIALADPGLGPRAGRQRYAVPALLVAGWGSLFAYSATYLMEDPPLRPSQAEAASRPDDGPRRIVVIAGAEAGAPAPAAAPSKAPDALVREVAREASKPAAPVQVAAAVPPRPAPGPDYIGVWGPTPAACGAPSRRRGFLPATITAERARAGRTTCALSDGHRTGKTWILAASCSERGRRWSSQVRLVVDGERLTWSSGRGIATYVRCGRRAG